MLSDPPHGLSPIPRIGRDRLTFRAPGCYVWGVPEPTSPREGEAAARSANPTEEAATRADAQLVRAIAGGDRKALASLYNRFSPSLMAVGQRILGDRREAED